MKRIVLPFALFALAAAAPAQIPTPEEFLGFAPGTDRELAPYPKVLEYLRRVDAASDRVSIEPGDTSTLGNPMPVVVLTSEANQRQLDRYREIARRLADPRGLSDEETEALVDEGKVVALVTCTIHSTEVGCTQMAMELVHEVATTDDAQRLAWIDETILLLMPSINPDGQVLVIDWYEEWKGTEYEGGPMPWLYHHYVGHDNNRDFYALTQKESRAVNRVLYHRWFPQVFVDEHQMGSTGPRMFVPPQTDPLAPEVHPLIFRQADLIGTNMARRLEEQGKTGVGHNMIYDSYWPGGTRNTAWWKNVTGLLTEVASVRVATPIRIESGELRGGVKGLPEYTRRANFPSPWPGGWWRLRDILDYERIATWALLESCAENRADILRNMVRMASEEIARGRREPPYAWVIPPEQHDPSAAALLIELLRRHGVEVRQAAEPIRAGFATYPTGTTVIPAAQPYRPFLLTMLRPQRYPEVRAYPDGPIIPPYDVTSWSLPIAMGVEIVESDVRLQGRLRPLTAMPRPAIEIADGDAGFLLPHSADGVYTLMNRLLADGVELSWLDGPVGEAKRGDVWIPSQAIDVERLRRLAEELRVPVHGVAAAPEETTPVTAARVGLYKPWVASMDEGWTRYLLDRYEFPYQSLANEDIRNGAFTDAIDVLVLPDVDPSILARGEPKDAAARRRWTPLPPRYRGGIDEVPGDRPDAADQDEAEAKTAGGKHLRRWVEDGGTLVALDSSADYVIESFGLPVENVLAEVAEKDFDCPGSMLRLHVDTTHPLAFGMRPQEAGYFAGSPAFRTHVPDGRFARRVVARYPDDAKDILVSGYLHGGERLERLAAVVEYGVGKGRVVLIGFRAQHRAQPHRTFKLLFNALYRLRSE